MIGTARLGYQSDPVVVHFAEIADLLPEVPPDLAAAYTDYSPSLRYFAAVKAVAIITQQDGLQALTPSPLLSQLREAVAGLRNYPERVIQGRLRRIEAQAKNWFHATQMNQEAIEFIQAVMDYSRLVERREIQIFRVILTPEQQKFAAEGLNFLVSQAQQTLNDQLRASLQRRDEPTHLGFRTHFYLRALFSSKTRALKESVQREQDILDRLKWTERHLLTHSQQAEPSAMAGCQPLWKEKN